MAKNIHGMKASRKSGNNLKNPAASLTRVNAHLWMIAKYMQTD